MRRIFAFVAILAVSGLSYYLTIDQILPRTIDTELSLDTPSPGLGRAIATAIHQSVTDPYFVPLERAAKYLSEQPQTQGLPLEKMTSWAIDDKFPTCFTWTPEDGNLKIDQASSPWALEVIVETLKKNIFQNNPKNLVQISTFVTEGNLYWMGFIRLPRDSSPVKQVIGVFFNVDEYLEQHVPRFIDGVVSRTRFPLVSFQLDAPAMHGENDGDFSIRILDEEGNTYLQRGRSFADSLLIYAESKWYSNPIVCMQEGWDLEVFSIKQVLRKTEKSTPIMKINIMFIVLTVLVSVFYWVGSTHSESIQKSKEHKTG